LLKLRREALAQRVVEHRIAGRVGEVAEHNRVRLGECRGPAKVEVCGSGGHQQHRRGGDRCTRHRASRRRDRCEFLLQLRGRLPPVRWVFFEATADDSFQPL